MTLSANQISNYKIINRCYVDSNGTNMSALREFDIDGMSKVWSVDTETLDTSGSRCQPIISATMPRIKL